MRMDPSDALLFEQDRTLNRIRSILFNQHSGEGLPCVNGIFFNSLRLFSNLGRPGNNQAQSLLTSTMKIAEIIRIFLFNEVREVCLPQIGLLYPKSADC